ncbi:MAG: L-seryl-tRNA(Sec) selenium transferase, partial [Actinomycetota bacterium]
MSDRQSISSAEQLRRLPQVERLAGSLSAGYPAPLRVEAARAVVADAQEEIRAGLPAPSFEALASRAEDLLKAQKRTGLVRVINATGVLLHTNLGRAPLGQAAISAIEEITTGYSNLEYDLATAGRGSRYDHASGLLKALTGADGALVVNNNAAAVLLCLSGLAKGKEAIVSRGELIEIGGEFRIPDIMALSEAVMTEVGTTNRTHLKDYEKAVGPETGAIVKV